MSFEQQAAEANEAAHRRAEAANRQYEDTVWQHAQVNHEIRDMVRTKVTRRNYEAIPGAIIHPDGVIELPV